MNNSSVNISQELFEDFEREAIPHLNSLYNFALRMTGNTEDASDIVQDTYLKAFRFYDKFEKGTNCKAWLFRILKNSFINEYRKKIRIPDKVDYDDIQNFYENIKASEVRNNHLSKDIFENMLDDEISEALRNLPEDFRTVIILCDIENFNYEEIAEFIDCPIGTVRSRLHRARKMLFTNLYKYAKNKGYIKQGSK